MPGLVRSKCKNMSVCLHSRFGMDFISLIKGKADCFLWMLNLAHFEFCPERKSPEHPAWYLAWHVALVSGKWLDRNCTRPISCFGKCPSSTPLKLDLGGVGFVQPLTHRRCSLTLGASNPESLNSKEEHTTSFLFPLLGRKILR